MTTPLPINLVATLKYNIHRNKKPYLFNWKPDKYPSKKKANENIKYIAEVCWLCGFIDKVLLVGTAKIRVVLVSKYLSTGNSMEYSSTVQGPRLHKMSGAWGTLDANRSCNDVFADWSRLVCMVVLYVRYYLKKKRKRRVWVQLMNKLRLSQGHSYHILVIFLPNDEDKYNSCLIFDRVPRCLRLCWAIIWQKKTTY